MNIAEFENMMEEIDNLLKDRDIPIHARSFQAKHEVLMKLKMSMIFFPMYGAAIPENYSGMSLMHHIDNWIKDRYGEKTKIRITQGSSVILIKREPYKIVFQKLRGSMTILCERNLDMYKSKGITIGKAPMKCNCLNFIEDLTQKQVDSLSDEELCIIHKYCFDTYNILFAIEDISNLKYIKEALGDLKLSVDSIFSNPRHLGMSKWSSLQFAEKVIKSFIALNTDKIFKHHNLTELSKEAYKFGLPIQQKDTIDQLQCAAEVRYNDDLVTLNEAVLAHHASLTYANGVANFILNKPK